MQSHGPPTNTTLIPVPYSNINSAMNRFNDTNAFLILEIPDARDTSRVRLVNPGQFDDGSDEDELLGSHIIPDKSHKMGPMKTSAVARRTFFPTANPEANQHIPIAVLSHGTIQTSRPPPLKIREVTQESITASEEKSPATSNTGTRSQDNMRLQQMSENDSSEYFHDISDTNVILAAPKKQAGVTLSAPNVKPSVIQKQRNHPVRLLGDSWFKSQSSKIKASENPASVALFSVAQKMLNDSAGSNSVKTEDAMKRLHGSSKNLKKASWPSQTMVSIMYPLKIAPLIKACQMQCYDESRIALMRFHLQKITQARNEMLKVGSSSMRTNSPIHVGSQLELSTSMNQYTDILLGRGGISNYHPANIRLRHIVMVFKPVYMNAGRHDKPILAQVMFDHIKQWSPPGRFMTYIGTDERYEFFEVDEKKALEKISQLFREKRTVTDFVVHDGKFIDCAMRTGNVVEQLICACQFP